jgi:hypothetical protein
MKKLAWTFLAAGLLAAGGANPLSAQMQMAETEDVEIRAQVVDLSCKQVYDLSGDMHRECAQVCADKGIPLALLAEDGTLYMPVSSAMPGTGSNEQLREHAERTVTVKGKRVQRAGINTIIIESITS